MQRHAVEYRDGQECESAGSCDPPSAEHQHCHPGRRGKVGNVGNLGTCPWK